VVYAGTREGKLWYLHDGAWLQQTNFPRAHAITAILSEADHSVWIGTEGGGLYHYKNTAPDSFQKLGGLLSEFIRALYFDPQGTLWIGTAGGGLSRLNAGRVTTFTTREGLHDNTISQILEDDSGRVWLGCNRGIACVGK